LLDCFAYGEEILSDDIDDEARALHLRSLALLHQIVVGLRRGKLGEIVAVDPERSSTLAQRRFAWFERMYGPFRGIE